jgi:hypothetical protein
MIVNTLCRYSAGAALFALLAVPAVSRAGAPTTCDKIAQDVRESVEKDPAKVLMYVEDALVISETCACEIVRAAITAAKADAELTKQIVQTSIAVAPRMTAVIEECAGSPSSAPVASTGESKKSGKDVVNVASGKGVVGAGEDGMEVLPPKDGKDGAAAGRGFGAGGGDIRGLYLIQPATGVFGGGNGNNNGANNDGNRGGKTKSERDENDRRRPRVVVVIPTSPTGSTPKDDVPK